MARNGPQPVFQDWNSEDKAAFDIQILDPLERNWKATLRKLLCLVNEERNRLQVKSHEFRDGALTVWFYHRGTPRYKDAAERLCKAILNYENEAKMSEITGRSVLGISPRSVEFDRLFRRRLSFHPGIPIYMPPYATAEPVTPTERDIDAAEKLLKWLIEERGEQESDQSLVRQLECADRDLARHIAFIAASTRELEVHISQQRIRDWRRTIDDQYYLALNAASKMLLSDEKILKEFLALNKEDNRSSVRAALGSLAAVLSIGSVKSVAAPLTFSNFGGFLTTMVWPTATIVNPITMAATLGLAMATLIGHLSESDAKSAASRLKQDLTFISEIVGICRQVDILKSWKKTASPEQSLHREELCAMNCPDTVALWTEFVMEVKRGKLEPRFPANRLSRRAEKLRGKKAKKQDVELCMSYLFVARAEEPGPDSDNDSGSSD